jgi:2-oxo-3-hexenedioate decarboxylase
MSDATAAINAAALARKLATAADERRTIPMLTVSEPQLDLEAAYAVQRAGVEARTAAGDAVIGYKLGLVSRAKQRAMGVAEPLWGWLTQQMLQAEDEPLELSDLIHPRVEPELAFLLARDVPAHGACVPAVLAATAAVFPALEVLDSRYEDFRFTLPDVVADNGSAARIVLGGRALPPEHVDMQREGMVLRVNGSVVDTAAGAAIAGHPAGAVAWLARAADGLAAGSIVLSGGLTAPVALEPGTTITAEYTSLGSVTLTCAR